VHDDIDDIDEIGSSSVLALVPAVLPLRRHGGLLEGPE
jgi:hypothetical protein